MADLALDVEVVAPAWDELDESDRAYLAKRAREGQDPAERLALELGLAQVVAVGMHIIGTGREKALVVGRDGTEADVLTEMWAMLEATRALRVVSFNGRGFDGPVLMVRSAINGVACAVDLCPYRYDLSRHCDLADVLTFWGAARGMYSLAWWAARFGIPSPKADMSGADVATVWRAGEYDRLAEYVLGDVRATAALYQRLRGLTWLFKGGPQPMPREAQKDLGLAGAA